MNANTKPGGSAMKFETMNCPECGERADGLLEVLHCRATITEQEDGTIEYAGESEMFWEEQRPVQDGELFTLLCHNGHEWKTRDLSDPQGELCQSYSEHLMDEIKQSRKEL
jgi:hypothetical protein